VRISVCGLFVAGQFGALPRDCADCGQPNGTRYWRPPSAPWTASVDRGASRVDDRQVETSVKSVKRPANESSRSDAEAGVVSARRRLGSLVHAPALKDASAIDKSFLLAMSKDDRPSKMADIINRLDVSKDYANMYRRRLIDGDLIEPTAHGYVDFTLPYLRDYLREHAAADV
jgi:hypothetical protein